MAATGLISIKTSNSDDDGIQIINQLLLPHVIEYVPISSIEDAHEAIKSMKVCIIPHYPLVQLINPQIRGAPAIASLASLAFAAHLSKALKEASSPTFLSSQQSLQEHVLQVLNFLDTARPTAVNLGAAVRRLKRVLENGLKSNSDVRSLVELLIAEGKQVADEDVGRNKEMSKHGAEWIAQQVEATGGDAGSLNMLTVCNTGSLATSVSLLIRH